MFSLLPGDMSPVMEVITSQPNAGLGERFLSHRLGLDLGPSPNQRLLTEKTWPTVVTEDQADPVTAFGGDPFG